MKSLTLRVGLLMSLTACGKKNVEQAPILGWHQEELWTGSCYYPPDYESLELTDRRAGRQASLEAMMSQWRGDRGDGVSVDARIIEDVETTLLGYPDQIEGVGRKNLEYCKQMMGGGATGGEWTSWLRGLPGQLLAGKCTTPLDYQLFDYLDIGGGWQQSVPGCEGNVVRLSGTTNDKYRISDGGDWINVEGDLGQPATGAEYPCNLDGCYVGQLIGRFVSEEGVEMIFPIGSSVQWTAPSHGTLSVAINDTSYFDNKYFKSGTIIDHTAIEIGPVE